MDECLVKYGGRCGFLQYNVMKPIKRGIKIWKQCDFEVYLGKSSNSDSRFGPIFDPVWSLCRKITGKNHHLYTDNFLSSILLVRFLYSKGIYMNSTVCQNKKLLPREFRTK